VRPDDHLMGLFERVKATVGAGLARPLVPLERIARTLKLPPDAVLFELGLTLQAPRGGAEGLAEVSLDTRCFGLAAALWLDVQQRENDLQIVVSYDDARFDPLEMRRLTKRLLELWKALLAAPHATFHSLGARHAFVGLHELDTQGLQIALEL
jgi:hypothetical protein